MFTKNDTYLDSDEVSVEGNLGLVRLCAGRFRGKGIEYEELYSAGCVGLVKAVKAFDKTRGVRFSTYAVPVILGEIRRLFRDGGALKVSRIIKERAIMISKLSEKFERENGRAISISEICLATGLERVEVIEALGVSQPAISLTPAGDEQDSPQIDLPVDAPDVEITDSLALKQVISELDETDRRLIYCRFFRLMTQQATANELGLTQVQVSRKEKKLLLYLRSRLQK